MKTDKLFVYGTLKSTHNGNMSRKLQSVSKLVCDRALLENAHIWDLGGFPGVRFTNNANSGVLGELVELSAPEAALQWLDQYEGVPNLYTRELVTVRANDGTQHPAYVYILTRDLSDRAPIANGEWNAKHSRIAAE